MSTVPKINDHTNQQSNSINHNLSIENLSASLANKLLDSVHRLKCYLCIKFLHIHIVGKEKNTGFSLRLLEVHNAQIKWIVSRNFRTQSRKRFSLLK